MHGGDSIDGVRYLLKSEDTSAAETSVDSGVQDRMVMGLLRAVADVVIVGSGTLDADPRHMWTPEAICPELASAYRASCEKHCRRKDRRST